MKGVKQVIVDINLLKKILSQAGFQIGDEVSVQPERVEKVLLKPYGEYSNQGRKQWISSMKLTMKWESQ